MENMNKNIAYEHIDLVDNFFYVKISVLNKIIRGNHGEYE